MSMKKQVEKALTFFIESSSGIQESDIKENVPPGWLDIAIPFHSTINMLKGKVIRMSVQKGLLRAEIEPPQSPELAIISKWLRNSLARESALTCMITGNRGYRRKDYNGWPCLSTPILIEYANELTEERN